MGAGNPLPSPEKEVVEGTLALLKSNHPEGKKYLVQGRLNGAFTPQGSLEEVELGDLGEYVASGFFGAKEAQGSSRLEWTMLCLAAG